MHLGTCHEALTEPAPWARLCKQNPAGHYSCSAGLLPYCIKRRISGAINVAWGAISAEYDTHCRIRRLLHQNGRFSALIRRLLRQIELISRPAEGIASKKLDSDGQCLLPAHVWGCDLFSALLVRLAQPERHMRRLHRLLHDGEQLLTELLWVYLLAQRGTEGRQSLLSIVLLAVETEINHVLDAPPQGLEERSNH